MSHSKERAEKNCLNCGETVQGRYCQACGQENIEPKETLWGLVSHFFQDITHFDGKFFSTGRLLFTRPGFLPKEYLRGKRASYLHPIRMYVFTSAIFFLIFYSVFDVRNMGIGNKRTDKEQIANLAEAKERSLKTAKTKDDSAAIERTFRMIDKLPVEVKFDKKDLEQATDGILNDTTSRSKRRSNGKDKNGITESSADKSSIKDSSVGVPSTYRYRAGAEDSSVPNTPDTLRRPGNSRRPADLKPKADSGILRDSGFAASGAKAGGVSPDSEKNNDADEEEDEDSSGSPKRTNYGPGEFGIFDISKSLMNAYNSRAEYDSVQAALPPDARDGWLKRRFQLQNIQFKERYGDDEGELVQDLLDKFIHTFPYLLFISLPLYALFLKLLYIRRKQFLYADHGLFLIYLYIFTFLHLLVFFGLREIHQRFDYWWIGLIMFIFVMYGIYYAYKSMKKFYEQRGFKTIIKFLIFNFLAFTTITFLFVLFFFIALLRL